MKASTEQTVRAIVGTDSEVDPSLVEGALNLLHGRKDEDAELTSVIRIKDVCTLLGRSQTSVQKYIKRGLLQRVRAAGKWTLGVSMESYIRFTENRPHQIETEASATHPPSPSRPTGWARRRQSREVIKRKIAYALRANRSGPRSELYAAITSFLKTHPEYHYYLVCEAVGIPAPSYRYHLTQSKAGMTESVIKRREILRLAQSLVPDKSLPVNVCQLTRAMNRHRHHFSDTTVGRVLKLNGYIVSGPGRKPQTSRGR